MTDFKKLLLVPMIAGSLAFTGCGGGEDHDDHDHEDHAEGDGHDHGDHADGHEAEHALGEITIAGTMLKVSVGGEAKPNANLHIDIEHQSGPIPATIRVWVGDESATGSVKGKAMGADGDYHADAQCPAELGESAALWVEVESADGKRTAQSLPLEHHEE